jgi:butyrate kinase
MKGTMHMDKTFRLLTINPGSTSTKVAYFENLNCLSTKSLQHATEELAGYESIIDQYPLRKKAVLDYLAEQDIDPVKLSAVVGRGGLLKPLKGGTYLINPSMLSDLKAASYGKHASNLGAVIASEIAGLSGIPAFIVDPVVVDEYEPLARYSGLPEIPRKSTFHALNQKAVARKASVDLGRPYGELNLIVAHLGGGISVAAHRKGKVIDVNNGLEEGPFSPERSGNVPVLQLVELCFSGLYTRGEIEKKLVGKGGLVAYLGTADCRDIEERAEANEPDARLAYEAMAYQVAKEIGACSTVLCGCIDAILITGGLARSSMLVDWIADRVKFIAPVKVYPGEDEMAALADGAYRVLIGQDTAQAYV